MLRIDNLHKTYRKHAVEVPVLRGVSLSVALAEFLAVVGMSGSGKSTMLHLMGILDSPDQGAVFLDGKRIDDLPAKQRDKLRNGTFGYIFQFYHLLPELTMLENVMAPAMIQHSIMGWMWNRRTIRKKAAELIERVGLSHRITHRPRELSGGEMQRAAIARALMNDPRVLLADEPTGNLDSANGQQIIALLRELNRDGLTIVMVTHHVELTHEADRIIRLTDGKVETETPLERSSAVQESEPATV
ncbi:MAG: ABC transporter ATP-binding protein [Gemmataceae bacterium]|nr:ABC transporter ATP-binding protein [Gemmataceae bacterium]